MKIDPGKIPPAERWSVFAGEVERVIERLSRKVSPEVRRHIARLVADDFVGYGPLNPMLADDELEDIMVIGVGLPVYVFHRRHGMCSTNVRFEDKSAVMALIDKAARDAGRRVDLRSPLIDSRMPDGNRLHIIVPPISLTGPVLSIRKFKARAFGIVDLIDLTSPPEVPSRFRGGGDESRRIFSETSPPKRYKRRTGFPAGVGRGYPEPNAFPERAPEVGYPKGRDIGTSVTRPGSDG